MCKRKFITIVLLLFFTTVSYAEDKPLTLSFGAISTDAEKEAVRLLIDYTKNIGEIFKSGTANITPNDNTNYDYILAITPDIHIETGGKDTFDSFVAKIKGDLLVFELVKIEGVDVPVPNSRKYFHVVPLAAGIETDRNFSYANAIAEVGYIPWYQNAVGTPNFLRESRVGLFVQGGYKFKQDNNTTVVATDGSEKLDQALARIKLSALISTPTLIIKNDAGIKVVASGDGWYDMRNDKVYHRVDAILKLVLTQTYSLDFAYQNGSGAPNFKRGDQFGVNLTIQY